MDQCKSLWGNHSLEAKEWFPPLPHPQSAQVRLMRTLLVSDDLTADLISATGGNRRFVPFRESHKGDCLVRFAPSAEQHPQRAQDQRKAGSRVGRRAGAAGGGQLHAGGVGVGRLYRGCGRGSVQRYRRAAADRQEAVHREGCRAVIASPVRAGFGDGVRAVRQAGDGEPSLAIGGNGARRSGSRYTPVIQRDLQSLGHAAGVRVVGVARDVECVRSRHVIPGG